jgi:hypothetical protein
MTVKRHEPFLGRDARTGTWSELARGTYRVILDAVQDGDWAVVRELLPVTVLEAEELHEVFGAWPGQIVAWLSRSGADPDLVAQELARVSGLVDDGREPDWEASWQRYLELTNEAVTCAAQQLAETTARAVVAARDHWRDAHDRAVDRVYGLLDVAVRLLGEERLPDVWNYLMAGWYDDHCARLDLKNQPWSESAYQLGIAIVDGFHAHLSGADRLGDVEYLEEEDRIGFRFAPCGSGGRVMRADTTGGRPRMEEPYGFSVTTTAHDWSFGSAGVCSYCVHCCLLNMTTPIDRLGYPTRVIEPPLWPEARQGGSCTWWIYRDPSLVPDEVYERVGRSPRRRPRAEEDPG